MINELMNGNNGAMNGNNGVQTISSREVAEMMEVRHKDMLRKIDGINEILNNGMDSSKYWTESTYKDPTGRALKEYQVTKEGCKLIACKTSGKKGLDFMIKCIEYFDGENIMPLDNAVFKERPEKVFFDKLQGSLVPFGLSIERQYNVLGYRLDGYIKEMNIAIEYDENDHKNYTYEKHELRQEQIEEELCCKFIRLSDKNTDEYNIGVVIKEIFNL